MAKDDNKKDETPIQFYIPTGRPKGPKIPIPINQPHWKYARAESSKPGVVEWTLIISFLIFSLSILVSAILDFNFWSPIFFVGIILTAVSSFGLGKIIILDKDYKSQRKTEKEAESEKETKAKHPRKRKNFK